MIHWFSFKYTHSMSVDFPRISQCVNWSFSYAKCMAIGWARQLPNYKTKTFEL